MSLTQAQVDNFQLFRGGVSLVRQSASWLSGAAAAYDQEPRFNNQEMTLLASAVRAATVSDDDRTNHNAKGLILIVDMTVVPGVATVTPKIQGKDPVSGKYYDILVGAAIVAVSTVVMRIYPGLTAAANLVASDVMPRTWRLVMTHSAGTNFTYSAGSILLL